MRRSRPKIARIRSSCISTKDYSAKPVNSGGKKVYGMYDILNKNNKKVDTVSREIYFGSKGAYIKYKNNQIRLKRT